MKSRPIILAKKGKGNRVAYKRSPKNQRRGLLVGGTGELEGEGEEERVDLGTRNMDIESKRDTLPINVKAPGAVILRRYAEMIQGDDRRAFERKFGKILDLAEMEVQPEAISTLA
ncbi:hypothetical protein CR513_20445, partial [Mucuna pruriens]